MQYNILVVDDEPDLASMFKRTLEREGFEVDAFSDPLAALDQFRPGVYNLLLIDLKMPKISGFDLYRKMMEIDSAPKVCFITAFVTYYDEFRRLYPSMNVNCFLRKPISGKDLIEQIRSQLNAAESDKAG